jgi:microcystin-dependent protein
VLEGSLVTVGFIQMYAGDTAPLNWEFCRGQEKSRTDDAALYAVIGTKFGAGNGSTTFNLPNFQGTVPAGYNTGGNVPAGIGGFLSNGVGERFGTQHNTLVGHGHGVNIWSGGEDVGHVHGLGFNTSEGSNHHDHTTDAHVFVHNPFAPDFNIAVNPPAGWPLIPASYYQSGTSDAGANHVHGVSGATYGNNVGHRHPINGNTDGAGAGDGTNANQPPTLTVNFIIRVR